MAKQNSSAHPPTHPSIHPSIRCLNCLSSSSSSSSSSSGGCSPSTRAYWTLTYQCPPPASASALPTLPPPSLVGYQVDVDSESGPPVRLAFCAPAGQTRLTMLTVRDGRSVESPPTPSCDADTKRVGFYRRRSSTAACIGGLRFLRRSGELRACLRRCLESSNCAAASFVPARRLCELFDRCVRIDDEANSTRHLYVPRRILDRAEEAGFAWVGSKERYVPRGLRRVEAAVRVGYHRSLGCYKANAFPDFEDSSVIIGWRNMFRSKPVSTFLQCQQTCEEKRFRFFGIRDGSECNCGNHFGFLNASEACYIPCIGAPQLPCGGQASLSVYLVKPATPSPVTWRAISYCDPVNVGARVDAFDLLTFSPFVNISVRTDSMGQCPELHLAPREILRSRRKIVRTDWRNFTTVADGDGFAGSLDKLDFGERHSPIQRAIATQHLLEIDGVLLVSSPQTPPSSPLQSAAASSTPSAPSLMLSQSSSAYVCAEGFTQDHVAAACASLGYQESQGHRVIQLSKDSAIPISGVRFDCSGQNAAAGIENCEIITSNATCPKGGVVEVQCRREMFTGCPRGYYLDPSNNVACRKCERGFYNDAPDGHAVKTCTECRGSIKASMNLEQYSGFTFLEGSGSRGACFFEDPLTDTAIHGVAITFTIFWVVFIFGAFIATKCCDVKGSVFGAKLSYIMGELFSVKLAVTLFKVVGDWLLVPLIGVSLKAVRQQPLFFTATLEIGWIDLNEIYFTSLLLAGILIAIRYTSLLIFWDDRNEVFTQIFARPLVGFAVGFGPDLLALGVALVFLVQAPGSEYPVYAEKSLSGPRGNVLYYISAEEVEPDVSKGIVWMLVIHILLADGLLLASLVCAKAGVLIKLKHKAVKIEANRFKPGISEGLYALLMARANVVRRKKEVQKKTEKKEHGGAQPPYKCPAENFFASPIYSRDLLFLIDRFCGRNDKELMEIPHLVKFVKRMGTSYKESSQFQELKANFNVKHGNKKWKMGSFGKSFMDIPPHLLMGFSRKPTIEDEKEKKESSFDSKRYTRVNEDSRGTGSPFLNTPLTPVIDLQ
eukprot:CAMPEP_0114493196 /NCGR_PEP_ID=MMETSP0109-20121206/3976_1 /TAXON_ID=29199 /ORGANISM="Chlorarachnion reptans, Strain CCCM449" /LENGTH=1057 /DNA_ID=CAMNT_0001670123 /DNA_START=280 /DNA_END=3454 /DNA_ORIENTATION=-